MFLGIEHDADPQDLVDVCDYLCTALGCSPVRAVELTSYQLMGGSLKMVQKLVEKSASR